MSPGPQITFRHVPGISRSVMRAVGFLEGFRDLGAASAYQGFEVELRERMNKHMDHWAAGFDQPKAWFHGFPNDPAHKQCFVFKHNEHRLYGFLCNPKPTSNPRFRLCVLTEYDAKFRHETDESILDRAEAWRVHPLDCLAIAREYPEFKAKESSWKN